MQTIKITCDVKDRVDYKSIKPFQGKLKELSKENFEKIKKSILEEGFFMPIGVWENEGVLSCLDGHQRLLVLEWLENNGHKIPLIPVFRIIADSFKNARKKLLHMVSQYGKVTGQGLYEFSVEAEMGLADFDNFSIPDLNMDSFMQEFFEDNTVEPGCDEDETPEPPVEPKTKLGDIYVLGNHRLLCGDSTSIDAVENLMDGQKADMVFTDPPYGMSVVKKDGNNNSLGESLNGVVGVVGVVGVAKRGKYKEVLGDDSTQTAKDCYNLCVGMGIKNLIFWGANFYAEALMPSSGWIVWDKDNGEGFFADGELAWTSSDKQLRIFKHMWKGMIRASEMGQKRVHPTQKPIALAEWCFKNYGEPKLVLDLFGGSGSTLIACEKTKRNCFMSELDPYYCDVIVSRFLKFTKGTKVIRNGEEIDWI